MSKNPKYIKIMSDLESQIKNNELNPGDQIPTEKNLIIARDVKHKKK